MFIPNINKVAEYISINKLIYILDTPEPMNAASVLQTEDGTTITTEDGTVLTTEG